MDPIGAKVGILVGLLCITLLLALVPLALKRRGLNLVGNRVLNICSCISGGVFLAALFLDLIPDVEEAVERVKDEIPEEKKMLHTDFPIAQLIICLGFFLPLLVEKSAFQLREFWQGRSRNRLTEEDDSNVIVPNDTSLRSIFLLMALSFHSIFEGMAIGLQDTSGSIISLFLAVIAHKGIMAFSLGLSLSQAKVSTKMYIISVMIFAMASPIGLAFGIFISDLEKSLTMEAVKAVLQGIAAGTFHYITFFEVLPHQFNQPGNALLKIVQLLIGFAAMTGILFIAH